MDKITDFLNKDYFKFYINSNSEIVKGKEKYSGFFRRFGATIVDLHLFLFLIILLTKFHLTTYSNAFSILLVYPLYNAILLKAFGMTPGKYIFGIKLKGETDGQLSFYKLMLREYLLKPMSIIPFGIGIIRMNFNPKKQTHYDKKLKIVVVVWRNEWIGSLFILAAILGLILEIVNNF